MGGNSGGRRRRAFGSLAGNGALLRVLAAYVMFIIAEYAVWIAMLVFAYGRGGAAIAGLVAVAQLVPAAVVAPVAASVADRRSPVVLLAGGYAAQAAAMAGTAAAVIAGAPLAAYAAAVVAATAVTTTRPAQAALIPSVATTPDQLTAANVVAGWLEAAGVAAAGLLAGALISLAGVGSVFVVCAGLGLVAGLLVAGLRAAALAPTGQDAPPVVAGVGEGLRLAAGQPRLRLMLALLTADAVVVGALDLLFVIVAISVLGRSQAWAGYLAFAFGAGAVLAATGSAVLVGRRLSGPILGAALAFSGALAVLASGAGLAGTVALLALAGAGHALLAVAARTLLQRSVPVQLIGRVFGVLEGFMMAGLALGALLVPALMHLGGSRLALLGVAAVLPLAAVAGGRAVFRLDAGTPVPVVQIALLRSLPLFAELPAPRDRGPGSGPHADAPARRRRLDPAGRPGRCLLRDRRGRARRRTRRAAAAPVRPRRRSGRDRAAASHPAHGHRDRSQCRNRVRARPGTLPGRGARPCSYPSAGGLHRRCAAGHQAPARPPRQLSSRPGRVMGGSVEHPLTMDIETMRRAGYATVDALVARLADPEADPVLRRADPAQMRSRLGGAPVPATAAHDGRAYADPRADVMADPDNDVLRIVPLLAGVPGSTIQAVQARGVSVDVAAGEEVTRRWDSDRFFYIVLSGRYDVFIDVRLIRTMGPGDHFGELAARDWGAGYGYARLATVRCAEPGRLLRFTSEDFQWLIDTEPAIKARLAATIAERLQQR